MANKNFQVKHGLEVGSTVTADAATGNITTSGDVAVNGGDITTTAATANIINTNATTVNMAGAATTTNIGASAGIVNVAGDLRITGGDIQNSTGNNAITIDSGLAPLTTLGGDLRINGSLGGAFIRGSDNTNHIQLQGAGNVAISSDLQVTGGDITTTATGTATVFNTNATTLNIGGGATTAVNIGNSSGEIITPSDVQQTGNKSFRQGSGPYTGSTDILRDSTGGAVEGYLATNNGMTATDTAFVSRNYGQNYPSSTITTAGPGKIYLGGTRGTPASPLANNSGSNFGQVIYYSNLGDTTGGGTGNGWSNDLFTINAQPVGTLATATQNHRQTLQATFTGSISGTTLTVTAVASGTITPGQELRGTGFNQFLAAITITRQLTSTAVGNALGSTGTYELNTGPGTIGSSTMTTYNIAVGSSVRTYLQPPNIPPNVSTVNNFLLSGLGLGSATIPFTVTTLGQSWWVFPRAQRIITEITGGNTLNIGTHNFTTAGASFTIVTAGNPNGLTTGTTYFVDTIPSSTTITLRTNSVSGGAVTGLTNGSGLFIEARAEAEGSGGTNAQPSSLTFNGQRRGQNFSGVVSQDNTRQNDWLGQINFAGGFTNGSTNQNTRIFASATEDWVLSSRTGTQINFNTFKTGTTNQYTSYIGAAASLIQTDSLSVINTGSSNMLTVDSSGNVIVTGDLRINGNDIQNSAGNTAITMSGGAAPLVTFVSDIQINGNDIQNSTGNTAITMASGGAPLITFAGDIQVNGNDIRNSAGSNNIILGNTNTSIRANTTQFYDSNTLAQSNIQFKPGNNLGATLPERVTSFALFHRRIPSGVGEYPNAGFNNWILDNATGNYQPNLSGETLGELTYGGQYSSTSSFAGNGPAVRFQARAAENFSAGANGGRATVSVTQIGTPNTNVDLFAGDSNNIVMKSGRTEVQTVAGTVLQRIDPTESWYRSARFVYGQVGTGSTIFDVTDNGSTGMSGVYSNPYATSTTGVNSYSIFLDNTTASNRLLGFSTGGTVVATSQFQSARRSGGNNSPTQLGDRLGQLRFDGNTNTGTGAPTAPVTGGEIRFQASENWTGSATGSQIGLEVTKTGTTTNTTVFLSDAVNTEIRGDTVSLADSTGTDIANLSRTNNDFYGTGWNFNDTAAAGSSFNIFTPTGVGDMVGEFKAYSAGGTATPTFIFTQGRGTVSSPSATQNGDVIGDFKFNGYGTSTGGIGGRWQYAATENWTNTANGTNFTIGAVKAGTTTQTQVFESNVTDSYVRGDTIYLRDSANAALTSANIGYTRTYGEFAYTNAAGFAIAAQNTIYTMPLDTTLSNSGVTISGTGNININVSGWYKIIMSLQVTLTVSNQPGQMDFWLRKNGVDVANSKTQVDLLKDQKAVIAMDWLVNSDGNDYWEIVYVGTTANYADIDFPTIAATTTPYVSPLAPALIVNVIPAGM